MRPLRVNVESVDALRASVCGPLAEVRSSRVTVEVATWHLPHRGWSGRLGALPGLIRYDLRVPRRSGPVTVRLTLAEPVAFHLVAGAILAALTPGRPLPVTVRADLAGYGQLPAWLPPAQNVASYPTDEEIIQPYDALVDGDSPVVGAVALPARQLLVDATAANPIGYVPAPPLAADDLALEELVRLAMTGLVLYTKQKVEGVADELAGILAEPLSHVDKANEFRSIRQRRAALRHHATAFGLVVPSIPDALRLPVVSAVTADPALLVDQTYPALDVVGDLSLARGSLVTVAEQGFRYGPEHVWDLVLAYHYSGAPVVGRGGGEETEVFTTLLSPAALLVGRAAVTTAGGWRPDRFGGPGYRTHAAGFDRVL
jgi:hypothetical protein